MAENNGKQKISRFRFSFENAHNEAQISARWCGKQTTI